MVVLLLRWQNEGGWIDYEQKIGIFVDRKNELLMPSPLCFMFIANLWKFKCQMIEVNCVSNFWVFDGKCLGWKMWNNIFWGTICFYKVLDCGMKY